MEKNFIKNYVLMTLISLREDKNLKFGSDSLLFKSTLTRKDCIDILVILTQACAENHIKTPYYTCTSNYDGTYNLTLSYSSDYQRYQIPSRYDEVETVKEIENKIPE